MSIVSLNAAISACGEAASWSMAVWLLETLPRRQLQANLVSFNACIAAAAEGDWQQALRLHSLMGEQSLMADVVTFNSIMLACSNLSAKNFEDLFLSFFLWEEVFFADLCGHLPS